MSAATVHPPPRALMMGTAVMAAAAAAVLAMGTQDARLVRLGLVAALWAALLGAFAAAQMRREACSSADHADQLRSIYQLELEREVIARREHTLTVERELREQAELTQRREIGDLRAELAAMRATLERLGAAPLVERVALRAQSSPSPRLLPLPAPPRDVDAGRASGHIFPGAPSRTFGPDQAPAANSLVSGGAGTHEQGRHGAESPQSPARTPPAMQGQRTVEDLIAAHGGIAPTARRRRNHA